MEKVCVDSIESAIAAIEGGARRLELCSALSEDGLTPSPGLLKVLKHDLNIKIPIFCMLRPNNRNDFLYSENEIKAVIYDLSILQLNGSNGFVFGALNSSKEIHIPQCEAIIHAANGLPVTFHRAFDVTAKQNMLETCETIIKLGFKRILTSGFEKNIEDGNNNIKELIKNYKERIIIIPGGGITTDNLENLIKTTKCKEFHASARNKNMIGNQKSIANINIVKELVRIGEKFL